MTPKTARAVRPNVGTRTLYQRKLERLVDEMANSVQYWILATYRAEVTPLAQDASPARVLAEAMRKLSKRWLRKFDKLSLELAQWFAKDASARSDAALMSSLRDAGFTVRYQPTRGMQNATQAIVQENVALIKSIPEQYLKNVEGAVMRSVATGRDLGSLAAYLERQHGVTKRRAAFIARDQNNKATSALNTVRQLDLGIEKGVWRHSGAGKVPRPTHVAESGKTFDLRKGAFIEGEWIRPGEKPNCRCTWSPVIPGFS